jgi:PTH2 family peptidyl-tRNA hydrolase
MATAEQKYPVMYLVVNNDLNMTKGKTAAQVGHAVQGIVEEIIRKGYETSPVPECYYRYMKWKKHAAKIVLKGTQEQLLGLAEHPEARKVIDDGQTQVPENSLTVVGFFPNDQLGELMKEFKLL